MRTTRYFFVFATALALAATLSVRLHTIASAATSHEYVTNGDFETGTDPWSIGGSSAAFDTVPDEVPAFAGAARGRLAIGTTHIVVAQGLQLGDAGDYHLSLRLWRTFDDVMSIQISTTDFCTNCVASPTTTVHAWVPIDLDVHLDHPSSVVIRIEIYGTDPDDYLYIDNVHFTGPPPVTPTFTPTPTIPPSETPLPTLSPTKTPTFTRTPRPTHTPRPESTPSAGTAATAADAGAPPPAPGAITNAGFEDIDDSGLPISWQKYGGTLDSTNAPVRSGAYAAKFTSDSASTKWIFQTVAVDGGAAYEFSAWIDDNDPAVASAFLRISWYASTDGFGTALTANDSTDRLESPSDAYRWLTTGAVAAPADAHSARLRIMLAPVSVAPARIFADDVAFGPADIAAAPVSATSSESVASLSSGGAAPPASATKKRASTQPIAPIGAGLTSQGNMSVVINEVLYDPDGSGSDGASEWVELYNRGDASVSLDGWSLSDNKSGDGLPPATIAAHSFVVFAASDSFHTRYPAFSGQLIVLGGRIGNSLGNDGDRLVLSDAAGVTVDAISWGTDASVLNPAIPDVPAGHSIERRVAGVDTNTADDFVDNESPSPGSAIGVLSLTKPQLQNAANQSPEYVAPVASSTFGWLPWAVAGVAVLTLVGVLGWRALPIIAMRFRHES